MKDVGVLLQIARGKKVEVRNDVSAFLLDLNIEAGGYKVYDWQLYYHYTQWTPSPMSKNKFMRRINKIFKRYELTQRARTFGRFYYKLSNNLKVPSHVKEKNRKTKN